MFEGKIERWIVFKSFSKFVYYDVCKVRWGDLWVLGVKICVECKVCIGCGVDDGGFCVSREGGKKGLRRVMIMMDGDKVSVLEKNVGRERRGKKVKKVRIEELFWELEEDDVEVEREVDEEMEVVWVE